jgi:hypothetical protein
LIYEKLGDLESAIEDMEKSIELKKANDKSEGLSMSIRSLERMKSKRVSPPDNLPF